MILCVKRRSSNLIKLFSPDFELILIFRKQYYLIKCIVIDIYKNKTHELQVKTKVAHSLFSILSEFIISSPVHIIIFYFLIYRSRSATIQRSLSQFYAYFFLTSQKNLRVLSFLSSLSFAQTSSSIKISFNLPSPS